MPSRHRALPAWLNCYSLGRAAAGTGSARAFAADEDHCLGADRRNRDPRTAPRGCQAARRHPPGLGCPAGGRHPILRCACRSALVCAPRLIIAEEQSTSTGGLGGAIGPVPSSPGITGRSRWRANAGIAGDVGADCHPGSDGDSYRRAPGENRGCHDGKHVIARPEPNGEVAIGGGLGAADRTGACRAGPQPDIG
jgi:hypothetical protein